MSSGMLPNYYQCLQRLYALQGMRGMKLGLDNSLHLNTALGFPAAQFPSIHIAGTNGKGSVSTKIAAALQFTGLKTGLYTSPHISSFCERIRINGTSISEDDVARLLENIFAVAEKEGIAATFFEITTLLAFQYFAEQHVDMAVIETGLGGAYDSTNIVKSQLCVITSLSLDHTDILGSTLTDIAREKAGIIKPGIELVLGPNVPLELIAPYAEAKQATYYCVQGTYSDYNSENSAIAAKCLELLGVNQEAIAQGIQALPPCRMEHVLPRTPEQPWPLAVILDVAHNPDGLERLFTALCERYPGHPIRVVCGLSSSKDMTSCVTVLKQHGSAFHLVAAHNQRALAVNELHKSFVAAGITDDKLFVLPTLEDNCLLALNRAATQREVLVICGSFFIMAAVRRLLGIVEPCDPLEL